MGFEGMWAALAPLGRAGGGGYRRYSWTAADRECRDWFAGEAARRGLSLERDRNGNLVAWWDVPGSAPRRDAVLTGSHLDSVPDGGAFDGPLGIVSSLAAIDLLRERGVTPARPLGVAVFAEEEGARFGVACLGSRLMTGAIDPARARDLRDADGVSWAEAMAAEGLDPALIGPDPEFLESVGVFV
jgi:N-carbamoyl-L-amino-acid hydrolase